MSSLRTLITFIVYYVLSTQQYSYANGDNNGLLKSWWPSAEFSVLQKLFDDCARYSHAKDSTYCLKNKVANAIERAVSRNISITSDLMLVRNENVPREFDNSSPVTDPDQRVARALSNLIKTHTFRVDTTDSENDSEDESEEEIEEGRGKGGINKKKLKKLKKKSKGKWLSYMMFAKMMLMSFMGPMALKMIGAVAGHAFLASKVAMMISLAMLAQQLLKGEKKETSTFQVHTVPEHHYGRNLEEDFALRKSDPTLATHATYANYPYSYSLQQQQQQQQQKSQIPL